MTPTEIDKVLNNGITLIVDTREQQNSRLKDRLNAIGFPFVRKKLDFGDYTAEYEIDGTRYSLEDEIVIERKMSLDEICGNFTRGRTRFNNEFKRASAKGCKVHLIVENGSYEKISAERYRSKISGQALLGSILSFSDRYNITVHFCKPELTPSIMKGIFYYHIRNKLIKEMEAE